VQGQSTVHPVLAVVQMCSTLECGLMQLLAVLVSSSNKSSCFGGVRWSVLCVVVRVAWCGVVSMQAPALSAGLHTSANKSTSVIQARH
jgi:hypothetical protein